jgi:branched-chain amino acid transport system ATP-binding protein
MGKDLLVVKGLNKDFEGVRALTGLDCTIEEGRIHGLIGPNGSGKTTFFNLISGLYPVTSGKIYFKSHDITNLKPHVIAKLGISRTFQESFIAPTMTCLENVMCGAHGRTRFDALGTFLRLPFSSSRQEKEMRGRPGKFWISWAWAVTIIDGQRSLYGSNTSFYRSPVH